MVQQVNLTFTSNQNWFLVFDMQQWATVYDLTQGTYAMHARSNPGAPLLYGWSSLAEDGLSGSIAYDASNQLLFIVAPYSDMRSLVRSGTVWSGVYDLQYTPGIEIAQGVPVVQDLVTGSLQISDGVTLT